MGGLRAGVETAAAKDSLDLEEEAGAGAQAGNCGINAQGHRVTVGPASAAKEQECQSEGQ